MSFKTARGTNTDKPEAVGFINFYLPRTSGSRKQLCFIKLEAGNAEDEQIAKVLGEEGGLDRLLSKLDVEYRPANDNSGASLDL